MLVRLQTYLYLTLADSYTVMIWSHPCFPFPLYCFARSAAAVDYFLDPSTGRYFVEVPPEDDDDEDFAQ